MSLSRFRKIAQHFVSDVARLVQKFVILAQIGEAQHGHTALPRAQQFAGAAQAQVMLRYLEAVGVLVDDLEPCTGKF